MKLGCEKLFSVGDGVVAAHCALLVSHVVDIFGGIAYSRDSKIRLHGISGNPMNNAMRHHLKISHSMKGII